MKLSFHLGLNALDPRHYGGFGGWLNACENDATALAAIATDKGCTCSGDFTSKATRSILLGALAEAAMKLVPGDLLFLSYSGHGGQVPSFSEADGYDETLCLFDGQITDNELRQSLAGFKSGVNIVLVLDSCHSGGMDRALGGNSKPRVLPARLRQTLAADYVPQQRATDSIRPNVLIFSACKENETASDGDQFGEWTGSLIEAWGRMAYNRPTWAEWFNAAQGIARGQTPQLRMLGVDPRALLNQEAFA